MAAKSWADPGLVFPNTLGAIGRRHYLMESYRRLLKAPGLPSDIRFHHLRHTSATPPPHLRHTSATLALRQGMGPFMLSPTRCSATPTRR
jgi:integrase